MYKGHGRLMPGAFKKPCTWHKLRKMSYIARHEDARKRLKAGEKELQCPDCLRYFFKNEYGKKPGDK